MRSRFVWMGDSEVIQLGIARISPGKSASREESSTDRCAFVGTNPTGELITSGLPAQNPKPAGPGRERYRCLRQERIIKDRDSAMLAT